MGWMQLIATSVSLFFLGSPRASAANSFTIDYNKNTFVKDGQAFRYISGSMHYGRVHPLYWQDRLTKMYMAGLDAVQTYVPWNLHEPKQGNFNFREGADIESFLQMAQDTGLLVILRAGPYVCGEWDMGGLPSWLLRNHGIKLRTSDPVYLKYVDLWMGELLPKVKPYLYANGGPVIMVQIENEYGSYPACDHVYMRHLLQLFKAQLGDDVVYFSTDGPVEHDLECGTLQGIYSTVDFGAGGNVSEHFKAQRQFEPKGPLVNSEYYTGWLDHWGQKHETRMTSKVVHFLDEILQLGANVNMYMFEGGTNFAYWNGANGNEKVYAPQPTSYDYDAPLTEAGDPNKKYHAIRNLIGKYKQLPPGQIPPATPKYAYGITRMSRIATLYEALDTISPFGPINTDYPISMEDMQQDFGFMLYRTKLIANHTSPTTLNLTGIRDRGYVLVDKKPVGVVQRNTHVAINITGQVNSTLDILVENMGRLNYGCCINDSKGIVSNATLGGVVLKSWQIYSLDLERADPSFLKLIPKASPTHTTSGEDVPSGPLQIPSFFVGTLPVGPEGPPRDTFLRMTGWSKGQAFVNGFNLGRYWPTDGPQITLYVPAVILTTTTNTLVLFETEHSPCNASNPFSVCTVEFIDRPILNSTIPPLRDTSAMPSKEVDLKKDVDSQNEEKQEKLEDVFPPELGSSAESGFYSLYEMGSTSDQRWLMDGIPDPGGRYESSESEVDLRNDDSDDEAGNNYWVGFMKDVVVSMTKLMCFFTSVPALVWRFI